MVLIFKNIFLLFVFISFFGCAPTVIETTKKPTKDEVIVVKEKKEDEIEVQKEIEIAPVLPVKPENKIINFNSIDKIVAVLSDDNLLTPIFYESFISEIENYPNIPKIDFVYSLAEINSNIENSLIIGPIASSDLRELPQHLGNNTFILALSNDYSLMNKYADNEIIFIPNSPYLHVNKLNQYIKDQRFIGVLYKQNDYGLKVFNHFKDTYPLHFIKSSSFGTSAIDLELSVNLIGNLNELDSIVIIDDGYSYKDLIGYLATDENTYPLDKIYLVDNFLEQRNTLENYYKPVNRTNFSTFDISNSKEPHREFLFHKSSELTLIIADKIFSEKKLPETINHPIFGTLSIDRQMIDYPIIFE
ncbi:MAG: hypothetical protein ACJ0RK_06350 [Alphaproteobacteria bacterium]